VAAGTAGRGGGIACVSVWKEKAPVSARDDRGLSSTKVGLSDADAEKWSTLLNQIVAAKLGTAAPQSRSTTSDSKTVMRLSQRHKHLDEGETARMIAAYQAGSSVYDLAEQFGCHRETVCRRLKSQGVQMRGRPLTLSQVDEAERLYAAGHSLASVGEHLGVWSSTVRKHLRARGVAMRPPHEQSPSRSQAGLPTRS